MKPVKSIGKPPIVRNHDSLFRNIIFVTSQSLRLEAFLKGRPYRNNVLRVFFSEIKHTKRCVRNAFDARYTFHDTPFHSSKVLRPPESWLVMCVDTKAGAALSLALYLRFRRYFFSLSVIPIIPFFVDIIPGRNSETYVRFTHCGFPPELLVIQEVLYVCSQSLPPSPPTVAMFKNLTKQLNEVVAADLSMYLPRWGFVAMLAFSVFLRHSYVQGIVFAPSPPPRQLEFPRHPYSLDW